MRFDPNGELDFQLQKLLNDGLEFGDNFRGAFIEIETTGEEQRVEHNLGYTPIGFFVILQEGQGDIWATRLSDWNNQRLFLKSNVTNLKVRLFVL